MKKDFLKEISKEKKKEFLNKLQSGKFTLVQVPFDLQESEASLNSLLKNKFDVVITFDESDIKKPFKSKDNSYSFRDLMRINHDSPDIDFLMDELTKMKYLECLEKWC